MELLKFNQKQIKKLLKYHTNKETIKKIIDNQDVMDLATRPVMIELILGALKDIEENKPIDISRIYLYSIRNKFQKDIKEERTFTSIPDKLYFMCELSWEMISTDNMSINYRLFPDRIRNLFGETVTEEKDIDHWQYDMMGQTMLIRNDDGDYKPAHRSLLEFFVAYKFAGELGVLDNDFLELAFSKNSEKTDSYYWNEYFKNTHNLKLFTFKRLDLEELKETFGKQVITRAIIDLIRNMTSIDSQETQNVFNEIIEECRYKDFKEVYYIVTNLVILLTDYKNDYFSGKDLSNLCIQSFNFPLRRDNDGYPIGEIVIFNNTNFNNTNLKKSDFKYSGFLNNDIPLKCNFTNTNLEEFKFHSTQLNSIAFFNDIIAVGSPDEIKILDMRNLNVKQRIKESGWHLSFSPNGKYLFNSAFGILQIRDTKNFELLVEHKLSNQYNAKAQESGRNLWTGEFAVSSDSKVVYVGCNNSFIYLYDIENEKEMDTFQCHEGVSSVSLSFDENFLISSSFNEFSIWNVHSKELIATEMISKEHNLNFYTTRINPLDNSVVIANENQIRFYDISSARFVDTINIQIRTACFSSNAEILYATVDNKLLFINLQTKTIDNEYMIDFSKDTEKYHQSIEEINLNVERNHLYLVSNRELLIFDLSSQKFIDRYIDLGDMTGVTFTGAKGIHKDIILQLKRNGGVF